MRTGRGAIGVIGIDSDKPGPLLTPDQRRLLDALIDQAALAIERVYLVEDVDRAKRTVETDRLRSALLTSISHDLKTPLASVLGAAGTLRDLSTALDDDAEGRAARHHHRRIRAAQPLHRQSARHDQARVRRRRAEHGAARSRRDRRQRAAAREQDPGASPGGAGARRRPADAGARCGAVRAGAVQSARQCRQICAAGTTIRIQSWRDQETRLSAGPRRGRRHSAGGPRAHLRQVLSRARRAIRCAPAPGSASRSRAASSRPCTARSRRRTAPTGPARSSPSRLPVPPATEQLDTAA